jgi:hypothetical protein
MYTGRLGTLRMALKIFAMAFLADMLYKSIRKSDVKELKDDADKTSRPEPTSAAKD